MSRTMSDYDDLIEDAENFGDEDDVDDDFAAEYNTDSNDKKRPFLEDDSNDAKRVKAPGCLADYFVGNSESAELKVNSSTKSNVTTSQNFRAGEAQSTDENAPVIEKGPNCICGISSVSKTTLKDGPNKNRMFWICSQQRESQCKFFEWCDEAKSQSNSTVPQLSQGTTIQQRSQQSTLTGPPCKCNLGSIQRTTMKEGPNQGRNFWVCPQSREIQCKFFEWENDDMKSQESAQGSRGSTNSNGPAYGSNSSNYNSSAAPSTGGGGSKGSCFKCGKEGHWSSNCPEAQGGGYNNRGGGGGGGSYNQSSTSGYSGSGGGGGGSQQSGSCYKCGEAGHWSSKCPKAGGGYKRK